MSAVAFDTLKFAQTLRDKAKLTPEQAEGISQAFADATSEQMATKADIAIIETKIDALEMRLTIRLGAMIFALGGVLLAVKFLGH